MLVFFYPLIPESPRFLAAKGEQEKAIEVLERIARINGKDLPDGVLVTATDQKATKSEAASDDGLVEILTQITRSGLGKFQIATFLSLFYLEYL